MKKYMVRFIETHRYYYLLEAESQGGTVEFLSTHPSPDRRADYIAETIVSRGYHNLRLKVGKEDYEKFVLNELKP